MHTSDPSDHPEPHDSGPDDGELVRRARDGDGQAFAALVRRHRSTLDAFCAQRHRDPHDREELAQLVLIRVWRGLAGFDQRSAFGTWLYRIVANTAATEHHRRVRRPEPAEPVERADPSAVPLDSLVVLRGELDAAFAGLAPPFRLAGELVDRFGCPAPEAARLCGVPEQTLRTRLFRARRALRTALTEAA